MFFVTGLPRSRTAWLAAWLSTGRATCYHDLLKTLELPALVEKLKGGYARGDSDSGLLWYWEELNQAVPDARWVLIERSSPEALLAYNRAFARPYPGTEQMTPAQRAQVWMHLQHHRAQLAADGLGGRLLTVTYDGLNQMEVARRVWEWVHPDPWDEERWREFDALKITVIPEKLVTRWGK